MKILNIHSHVTPRQLCDHIAQKLNPLFHGQKQEDIDFITEIKDEAVVISQPDMYEGYLFSIAVNGNELWITRSEHYVDDPNSLTVEAILNQIFEEVADGKAVTLILEG